MAQGLPDRPVNPRIKSGENDDSKGMQMNSHLSRRAIIAGLAATPAGLLVRPVAALGGKPLVLATAGQGSAFLAFGQALVTAARHAQLAIDIRETKGSNENAELVSA